MNLIVNNNNLKIWKCTGYNICTNIREKCKNCLLQIKAKRNSIKRTSKRCKISQM